MSKFIEDNMKDFVIKYPKFSNYQDYHVFTEMCIKYYYYSEGNGFDQDLAENWLTDGANDGGIDAIINDQNSENNDVIIIQSKYYNNSTKLTKENFMVETNKMVQTIKDLSSYKFANYNDKVVSAFKNAMANKEEDGEIKIVFFSSYEVEKKKESSDFRKAVSNVVGDKYQFEINCAREIESEIEMCNNGKLYVDRDELDIDLPGNYLTYEDSAIVNISAKSLQDLFIRRNGLLGRNLRYYIKQKTVDEGIAQTIRTEPESFWYKNNGIVIICDDFEIDGKKVKLRNFSIVNGGQTTNRISQIDIENDFYLQCKIVKVRGFENAEKDNFILGIAEATNSQKPIKLADLKANSIEQINLRTRLNNKGVYYITKKGDKTPKQYPEPYQSAKMEEVGKLSLAAVLQMPGSARSNSKKMYNDENYYLIFGAYAKEGVIADSLKISYFYDQYIKFDVKNKGYDSRAMLPMAKNGKTFQLACISLLCKINYGVINYESEIEVAFKDTDRLKKNLKEMGN